MTKDPSPLPDNVEFIPAAKRDYLSLDRSVRVTIVDGAVYRLAVSRPSAMGNG